MIWGILASSTSIHANQNSSYLRSKILPNKKINNFNTGLNDGD